jgi:hypothetical protein
MAKPALILVGADKGGVGKTTVARTLLDYLPHIMCRRARSILKRQRGRSNAFIATSAKWSMLPRSPIRCASSTRCQTDTTVTVVDVRAGLMSPTLHALRDIGFLEAVKKGQITFVVFHILGSSIASLNEIEETAPFTADAEYFLVKNFINNTNFFEWDQVTHTSYFKKLKDAVVLDIPKLNEMAYEQVELASVPFLTFVANKDGKNETANYSFVLRGYVRHWLGNVWAEYHRVKLLDLFGAAAETTPARAQAGGRS